MEGSEPANSAREEWTIRWDVQTSKPSENLPTEKETSIYIYLIMLTLKQLCVRVNRSISFVRHQEVRQIGLSRLFNATVILFVGDNIV
jgi:hypothetical protein